MYEQYPEDMRGVLAHATQHATFHGRASIGSSDLLHGATLFVALASDVADQAYVKTTPELPLEDSARQIIDSASSEGRGVEGDNVARRIITAIAIHGKNEGAKLLAHHGVSTILDGYGLPEDITRGKVVAVESKSKPAFPAEAKELITLRSLIIFSQQEDTSSKPEKIAPATETNETRTILKLITSALGDARSEDTVLPLSLLPNLRPLTETMGEEALARIEGSGAKVAEPSVQQEPSQPAEDNVVLRAKQIMAEASRRITEASVAKREETGSKESSPRSKIFTGHSMFEDGVQRPEEQIVRPVLFAEVAGRVLREEASGIEIDFDAVPMEDLGGLAARLEQQAQQHSEAPEPEQAANTSVPERPSDKAETGSAAQPATSSPSVPVNLFSNFSRPPRRSWFRRRKSEPT